MTEETKSVTSPEQMEIHCIRCGNARVDVRQMAEPEYGKPWPLVCAQCGAGHSDLRIVNSHGRMPLDQMMDAVVYEAPVEVWPFLYVYPMTAKEAWEWSQQGVSPEVLKLMASWRKALNRNRENHAMKKALERVLRAGFHTGGDLVEAATRIADERDRFKQDLERTGAMLLMAEDDDGKVRGFHIDSISGGADYRNGFPRVIRLQQFPQAEGPAREYIQAGSLTVPVPVESDPSGDHELPPEPKIPEAENFTLEEGMGVFSCADIAEFQSDWKKRFAVIAHQKEKLEKQVRELLGCVGPNVPTVREAVEHLTEAWKADDEPQYKLCYVDGGNAYFTTLPLEDQDGDDWNDASYEHNAGLPYDRDGIILKLKFDHGFLHEPCEGHTNSPWSVQQINQGGAPWLSGSERGRIRYIWAGADPEEFRRVVEGAGGAVYVPWVE